MSVRFDAPVRRALVAAIEARPRRHSVWVGSPPSEFRQLDRGGRTVRERAFTRSAYYIVRRLPMREGSAPYWSLQIAWGPITKRGGRWGRVAQLRMRRYYSGARHAAQHPASSWAARRELQSKLDHRVDGTSALE
jgi:hypothetical protein